MSNNELKEDIPKEELYKTIEKLLKERLFLERQIGILTIENQALKNQILEMREKHD
ncbi:MAG: hypothetical protein QXH07_07160 [Thermoplasmata archaeon]